MISKNRLGWGHDRPRIVNSWSSIGIRNEDGAVCHPRPPTQVAARHELDMVEPILVAYRCGSTLVELHGHAEVKPFIGENRHVVDVGVVFVRLIDSER